MPVCHVCLAVETPKSRCPECNRAYMKAYRAANLEKVKAGQRDHYARNRDRVIEKVKAYAFENKDRVKAAKAKRYDQTREARQAKIKEWQTKNPEKHRESVRAATLNRVARKAKAPGKYTVKDIRRLYDEQNGKCPACDVSLLDGYHVDHVVPLSKGGDNWPTNLQLLCPPCNLRKSDMSMDDFMARNFPGGAHT